jgi:uncharacterized membrane protein HdeD (DUF308 family)
MAAGLATNWWSPVIRGVVATLLGIVVLRGLAPRSALARLFGAYALIHGIVSLAGVWRASKAHKRSGALLLEGLVGIAVGIVTIASNDGNCFDLCDCGVGGGHWSFRNCRRDPIA